MVEHPADDSASRHPAAGRADAPPPKEVPYKEYRARLDKNDHLLADPNAQLRHHTAMLVKKTELAPGEIAALRSRRGWGSRLAVVLVVLIAAGGVAVIYSPWLAPPPPNLPPPPPDPVLIPPNERPPVALPPPAPPPAFPPREWKFSGPGAVTDLKTVLRDQGDWNLTAVGLTAPPHPALLVSWLKAEFSADLAVELELAVDSLPGRPDDTAREFRLVFGDGVSDNCGVHFRVPSLIGQNHAEVFDELGAKVASYGHNRYGWPFEAGRFYRLKVVRKKGLLTISRDGEVICTVEQPEGNTNHIGLIPVSGATLHWIRVEAR